MFFFPDLQSYRFFIILAMPALYLFVVMPIHASCLWGRPPHACGCNGQRAAVGICPLATENAGV
ncbi:MAG TPA: hypothetical protein DC006_06140 [Prevotellaceae bacterium]|nr:hypothetical protein [Prevotellaceae bacterium]